MTDDPLVKNIPIDQIKPFISRARGAEGFAGLKASIKAHGVKIPIQVRDLGRKDDKGFRYELICGEGRTAACKALRLPTVPALVLAVSEAEIAGRFMAENLIRKDIPWQTKGRMIRQLVQGGQPLKDVAEGLGISAGLAEKYLRILDKQQVSDLDSLTVNEAEKLVTLPGRDQKIIMEVVRETGQSVEAIVEKAKAARSTSDTWTKATLLQAMRAEDERLKKQRERLKLARLHHAIGPRNIRTLCTIPAFVRACAGKVNLSYFTK